MHEWSKLDNEADTSINNALKVFDGRQKDRNNAADPENETISENLNLYRESVIILFI